VRIQPSFDNFMRVACETIATSGAGVGGATATFRLTVADGAEQSLRRLGQETAESLLGLDGVTSVLVGVVRPEVTSGRTRESDLRGSVDPDSADAVVLVDGVGEQPLEAALPAARRIVEAVDPGVTVQAECVYGLAFLL
jgi:hypothetical protein